MSAALPDLQIYDTTLRDGLQQEGLILSVAQKLAVARVLDNFGVTFIEGGWPGAIPKDTEFFRRARTELFLRNAQLVAFGATRRPDVDVTKDPQVRALLEAQTATVTLVAKSAARHVDLALRTTLAENLAMIRDTVAFLVAEGRRVFVDAEHFFDGYRSNEDYALEVVRVAAEAGAEAVVLCDTNGGMLPGDITEVVSAVREIGTRLGIHCHDDTGCAVANTLDAVSAGVSQVQVTANGFGERCGNANLFTVVGNLNLKLGLAKEIDIPSMTAAARTINEISLVPVPNRVPYVGRASFAHKAGLHASAVRIDPSLYQHIEPADVGNVMRTLVSDQAGRSSIEIKARELGYDVPASSPTAGRISRRVKELEQNGYSFETADASFELLIRAEMGNSVRRFAIDRWRLTASPASGATSRYTVELSVIAAGEASSAKADATNAIDAMDHALRLALTQAVPELPRWKLTGSQIWHLDGSFGRAAGVRVLLSFAEGGRNWSTVGVGDDIVAASWRALQDAADYVLLAGTDAPQNLAGPDAPQNLAGAFAPHKEETMEVGP